MANVIRIKRRASGASGAPGSLKNAELAFNEVDNTLYYGKGMDGSGNATDIIAIGGNGYVTGLVQTASGALLSAINAETAARGVDVSALSSAIDALGTGSSSSIDSLSSDMILRDAATLASAQSYTDAAVADLVDGAPTLLNTLKELASAIGDDQNFAVTLTTKLGELSSAITSAATADDGRFDNLETAFHTLTGTSLVTVLGTIADQNSDAVDITGGTISGVSLTATGTAEFSNIHASGSVTIDSGLTVTSGATNLSGSLAVGGNSTLNGTLTVEGATTINDSLSVTGNATFDGNLTATTGTATFGHVNLTSLSGLSAYDFELFNCTLDSGSF